MIEGAAVFVAMMIPEIAIGAGMILAFPEPAAPAVEPVLFLLELKFVYLSGIGLETFHQAQSKPCKDIDVSPDPRDWFK
jgi:hypothetical protein